MIVELTLTIPNLSTENLNVFFLIIAYGMTKVIFVLSTIFEIMCNHRLIFFNRLIHYFYYKRYKRQILSANIRQIIYICNTKMRVFLNFFCRDLV